MAITCNFGRFKGNPRVVNKTIQSVKVMTGVFVEPISLMNPKLKIQLTPNEMKSFMGESATINYAEIQGKHYYLVDVIALNANFLEVHLKLDVLNTYKNSIKSMEVMLERSSSAPNPNLPDSQLPLSIKKNFEVYEFPEKFSDREDDGVYIMVTSQKGYTL